MARNIKEVKLSTALTTVNRHTNNPEEKAGLDDLVSMQINKTTFIGLGGAIVAFVLDRFPERVEELLRQQRTESTEGITQEQKEVSETETE